MENRTDKIIADLKQGMLSKTETSVIKNISVACNSFTLNYNELIERIVEDPDALSNFKILAAACAIYMGYTWKCDEIQHCRHWDERNTASQKFCYQHFSRFLKLFEETSGFPFPFRDSKRYQYFMDDNLLGRMETKGMALADEVRQFSYDHPTLQQKMIGLFMQILYRAGVMEDITKHASFPFV